LHQPFDSLAIGLAIEVCLLRPFFVILLGHAMSSVTNRLRALLMQQHAEFEAYYSGKRSVYQVRISGSSYHMRISPPLTNSQDLSAALTHEALSNDTNTAQAEP
jgi:hypothetical protein